MMSERIEQRSQPISTPAAAPLWQQRSDGITILAGYHFVVAGLFLIGTLILMLPTAILGVVGLVEDPEAWIGMTIVGFLALGTMIFCLIYLAVGYGLWTLRSWARVTAIALALVSLVGFPIGTIAGAITLWQLLQADVAARFR